MTAADIVQTIVDAFTGVLSGCASGIVSLFQVLFMNASTVEGVTTYSGISQFGIWTLSFIGVGVALAILRKVTGKVVH